VVVVDVAQARTDPAHSVVARVPAGDSPVRMTVSPDGQRIYVTARGSNAVLVFDADKLITDSAHARLAKVTVGSAPVPLALIQDGKTLVVGNSNRFNAGAAKPQALSVLDVAKMGHGSAIIGIIAAGAFPREMSVSSDGRTLFVSNFGSNSLEVIDAQNPPVESK
jgi:YVTN family beta-propeller protein